jgi:hypothetical protein
MKDMKATGRYKGSGPSELYGIRLKATASGSIDRRTHELGMTFSDYVRELLRQDTGVEV